jgi:hypothetical protein
VLIEEKNGKGCCFYNSICMAVLAPTSLLKNEQLQSSFPNRKRIL